MSGRLVPLDLLPNWAQTMADWLPYQWSFGFPIELLIGQITFNQTLNGFLMQGIWTAVATVVMLILWRFGLRTYSAVGA